MPAENHEECKFFFKTAEAYFGSGLKPQNFDRDPCVIKFLNDSNTFILGCLQLNENQLHFFNDLEMSENATQALIFVKTKQKPISMNEIRSSVIVISLCDSLIQSFYSSLSTFYAPLLLKSAQSKPLANDPKIQTALAELSAGLSLFLREQVSRNSECTNVLGLSDELEFWKSVSAKQHGKKSERRRADLFVRLLEPAVKECLRLENSAFTIIGPPKKIKTRLPSEDTGENHIGIALAELLDVLDTHITDSLDEVWRCLDPDATQPFPESRMRQLIEAIGYWIVKIVQMHLGCTEHNEQRRDVPYSVLWTLEFRQVKPGIQLGIKACKQWQKSSELLTQKLWRRYAPHPWEGPQPNLAYLTQFCARLTEVLNLRGLYEHLCRLLTRDERTELRMDRGLEHFLFGSWAKDMEFEVESSAPTLVRELFNPLLYNPYTAEQWASAMSMIDSKLRPAEERAASRLRTRLLMANPRGDIGSSQISPIQLLREFQTYQELIRRPIVSQILQAERETMLGYLEASLKEFREEFLKGTGAVLERKSTSAGFSDRPVGMITAKNIPESINRILWAGHMESRVSDDLQLVEVLLSDLDRFGLYKQEAMSLIEDVATWRREQFEAWSRDRLARLADKKPKDQNMTLAFEPSGHLLTLSTTDGKLEVGYPDGLVQLQREVRLLTGLGYPVPSKLIKAADQGEALYRYAIVLKQVAHFYNSIDSQMIPSQQALMLNSALAFERLIKSPQLQLRGNLDDMDKGITWDQLSEVETYISQLQAASRQLMSENRKLRKVHFTIVEKIIRLLEVDLLRNQPRWRSELADIRYILSEVANQGGYPPGHMTPWKAHMDRQLYKVLEHQYRNGLEALTEKMPELRVDMVYHQSRLGFRPPFEEIKARYYREMRKFIAIPTHFRGVSELPVGLGGSTNTDESNTGLIFPWIVTNQATGLSACYRKAELLFTRLEATLEPFREWVVLGNLNLDELVDSHCRELIDFERNFKGLKTRGRDAEKLPNEIRIDCITVNCVPIKMSIEGLLQNLFEALQTCLRRSIQGDLVAADAFLTDALDKLSQRPQTVDELSEAKARQNDFAKSRSRLMEQLSCAEAKDRLLRSVAGAGVSAVSTTKAKWEKFQMMMESFRLMMDEQLEVMKSNVQARTTAYFAALDKFTSRWNHFKPGRNLLDSGDHEACKEAVRLVRDRQAEFRDLEAARASLIRDYEHFEMAPPSFATSDEVAKDLDEHEIMWTQYENFSTELEQLAREDWISFRSKCYLFDEFLTTWFNKLRSTEANPMTVRLQKEIDHYWEVVPALKWVRGDALSPDHWLELFRLIGLPRGTKLDQLTFGDLLRVSRSIVEHTETLKSLTHRAQAEVVVREALQELDVWGAGATFTLTDYIDSSGQTVCLVKDWKDIVSQVGDNMALLASLQDSPYFDSFADRANAWTQRLADLDHGLTGLQSVQRRWVYLEPILGRGALPKEAARFAQVDAEFRRLLQALKVDNRVVSLVSGLKGNALKDQLTNMQDQLARCQRALNEYLEDKRSIFPRFYFLGDDDLLEILGQSTNPAVIQTHLRKLFQGIHHVQFDGLDELVSGKTSVATLTAMCSLDGETVPLQRPIQLTNEVEVWLGRLATEMQSTLSENLTQCLGEGSAENQRRSRLDPNAYPGQVLTLSEAIHFARNVEDALNCGRLSALKKDLQAQLTAYTSVDLNFLRSAGTEDISVNPMDRGHSAHTHPFASRVLVAKLNALVLDTVHSIDVVDQLIQSGAATSRDWAWQRQLRFYTGASGKTGLSDAPSSIPRVCMVDAQFNYTFEYQGNAPRLVHTPLTDKCYLTLTQAMRMGLGGNPYGPAGTGKTESVKALGGLMGRQVLVFNCDEGIDVRSMGRILVGIVKCGAWGCFDEFNRLEESVLSAVSMQIQVIQDGLRSSSAHIILLNRNVSLDPNSGLFITLNPAGKGYGGRQKLPDNLKQLFRPVAMTQPDVDLIAEMILFAEGFRQARELGRKLVSVFSLAKQLLSVQQHYDWGLRALKTVLHSAGSLLQSRLLNYTTNSPDEVRLREETVLIIRAARSNTLAKLTTADASRFEALLHDVFPDPTLHQLHDVEDDIFQLKQALHAVVSEHQMVLVDAQIRKALEVYEQTKQRMGVVLVGPSGCGKSTVLTLLRLALSKIGHPVRYHVFNPKSMLRVQLLGRIDSDTREWTDGVLTHSARSVVKEDAEQHCWIVCDGDIDPEWVESLNSVLDDNRLLTLPSGERIQFGPNVNFLFETHELTQASPATVSRMGVVYVSDEATDPKALVGAWLAQQTEADRGKLEMLINPAFYQCLEWVYQNKDFVVETSPAATVFNGLSHLVGAVTTAKLTVGLIRGLGANLTESAREALANLVYETTGESPPDPTRPLDVQVDPKQPNRLIPYPPGANVALLVPGTISAGGTGACQEISLSTLSSNSVVARQVADSLVSGHPPLVLTPDVRRAIDSFRCWLEEPRARQSFLLVGPEGCGKSLLLDYCFCAASRPVQVATVQCSAQTTPAQLLEKLSQLCITVTSSNASGGRVLRPREGERLILYLRDLNLPKPDKWGSCQLTAFLQQLLTYHGYYDPSSLEFVGIEGIQFVGSFTPATTSAGLGRHHLSARFTSALRLAVIDYPDKEQLIAIYSTLLQAVVYSCTTPTNLSESGGKVFERTSDRTIRSSESTTPPIPASRLHVMATIMVDLLNTVQQHFRADEHAHCVFTPHVLTSWTAALWRYDQLHGKDPNAIWAVFGYEARRLFRDRVPGERARGQFDTLITGLLYKHLTGSDVNSNGSSRSSSDRKVHSGPSVDLQLALKFATGEIDGEDEEEDAELSSGGVKDTVTRAGSNNDDLLLTTGWFTTWGALDPVHAECPIPLHGRPLGFVNSVQTRDTIHRGLIQLAREHCPRSADLVLFPEFVDLVCRLDRALSVPAGSVLLAGRAGIGRRSALTLVAHLHQFHVCHLRVGRDYGMRQFTTDVKAACQAAGLEDKRTLLCIEDQQITDDGILEIINSLLASGEALGIMTSEELDALSSTVMPASGISLREASAEAGHRGPLTSFFASRVRANLHIALILDTDDHERFTGWLRANPSFYKCCVTQWLDDWTKRTLLKLPGLIMPSLKSRTEPAKFMQGFVACHVSAPHSQLATPRRYWALCAAYGRIEKTHRVQLEAQISRLQAGLTKLREARERVSQLKKSAAEQGAQLTEKQSAADKALEQISAAMQGAAEQRTEMELLRTRVSEESKNLERRKAAIDSELAEIEPLVQQARAAVGSIRPEALSEIRALRAPPDAIRDILEGVLLLMGIRDTSWVSMRGFLAKRGVQEEILNFDARKISPEIRSSVERLLAKNEDSFDPKIARRASVAAAPLATWVRANVQYAVVLERIAPLEAEQAQLRGSLAQTETALTRLAEDLAGVDSKVARLRSVFEQHTSEATRLKAELDRAKETLASAEALVGELEGEHARWKNQVNEVNSKLNALPSLALLSAAFITYLSASPEDVRRKQLAEWSKQFTSLGLVLPDTIMAIENATNAEFCVDIRRFLTTERELLAWRNQGLPSDRLSGENAVVILETNMCPLIVDPSSRAVNWLKSHLKDQHLEVVNQQSSNFTTTLELAVRFGKCLIIQEVDEIEPILFPILSGKLTSHGSRSTVTLGDKTIDYHPEFRLFLCTRQTPSTVGVVRPACASSLVTMVNFETTRAGLVDQLLATSLQHERPELEQRRQELVRAEEGMKLELAQLEDNLLEELANARGNILENKELLQSLNRTKQSSLTIAESLTESARLQSELDKERNVFYPLAEAGSRVYFVLTDIVKINWMYQFSLKSFLHLFQRALEAPHDPSLPANERMSFLQKRLEALVYEHVLQSLFKADRLMFTLHMARCLRPGAITDEEWAFFTGLSVAEPTTDESAAPKWLDPERVRDVMRLKAALPELYATLRLDDARIWSNWMNQNEVELSAAPTALQQSQKQGLLTPFHLNVLAVQALRPDRLHTALDHFATRCLNLPQLGPSTLNLSRLYESETRFNEPILLLISPGADPSQELAEAAAIHFDRVTGSKSQSDTRGCLELPSRYRHVAMGQGQADLALEELRSAAEAGDWLCLKNLHLVVGWLPILEKEINTLLLAHESQPTGSSSGAQNAQRTGQPVVHKDFRLWLTAEPHPGFPSALLQSCLKVAYEDYTILIDSLPEYDLPSYFNLPANIDRSAQRTAGNRVIAQLRLLKRNVGPNWLERAETDHLIQSTSPALDLADLFRPSTFLNAVRQQTARQMGVPIDSLKLASLWPDGMRGSSETQTKSITIRVTNLKLEGALFESGHLTPSHPESPSLTHLPDIYLMWIPKVRNLIPQIKRSFTLNSLVLQECVDLHKTITSLFQVNINHLRHCIEIRIDVTG
ncbi:Cytoplasmic dynein 2 heavy chain 1 [Fasciola hepatica]|uniref:Cytoplasmic dynein 2 heavy chain 1 n=1 Tax=Fasciola hepatica TaxID=6192 RepID=A0A4E0RU62_FASHE|nr:Cytoplasmic dynein 2 heavy chain 1 [Fasciola hepatica]